MENAFGLQCPHCANTDSLDIEVRVWVTVVGGHVQDPYDRSKTAHEAFDGWQWEGNFPIHCPKCKHTGTVDEFQATE